jgi:outer membrane lipoprotein SlyB
MKIKFTLAFAALALTLAAGQSHAAGCLKGAAVGGVGEHFVGSGHAVLGAAGGAWSVGTWPTRKPRKMLRREKTHKWHTNRHPAARHFLRRVKA